MTSAAYFADGASVLIASRDRTAKLWSVESGECTQTMDGQRVGVIRNWQDISKAK